MTLTQFEFLVWSLVLGSMLTTIVPWTVSFALRPSARYIGALTFGWGCLVSVAVLSGTLGWMTGQDGAPWLRTLAVVAAPLTGAVGCQGLSVWLDLHYRDPLGHRALRIGAVVFAAASLACLLAPVAWQLPASAALSVIEGLLMAAICLRATALGDPLSRRMGPAYFMASIALAGLYADAYQAVPHGWPHAVVHVTAALCAATGNLLGAYLFWTRTATYVRLLSAAQARQQDQDPITGLLSARQLVQKILRARERIRSHPRPAGLVAVSLFDLERLSHVLGRAGVDDLLYAVARRVELHFGLLNPVGRYWGGVFVVFIESIYSTDWLHNATEEMAAAMREPFEVKGLNGEMCEVLLDYGVGSLRIEPPGKPVEDLLDQVQQLSHKARLQPDRLLVRKA